MAVIQGSSSITDSVVISVDISDNTGSGFASFREFAGTQEALSLQPNHFFFSYGRTLSYSPTGTPVLNWRPINVKWRLSGFYTFYASGSRAYLPTPTDTVGSIRMDLSPANQPLLRQTDSALLTISYTNELGAVKEFTLRLLVRDLTELSPPNTSMIFPTAEYLTHKTQPAVLESLFNYYRGQEISTGSPRLFTMPSGDTSVSLTSLLFNYRSSGTRFRGEDTAKNWRVSSSIPGKDISGIAATPTFTYTNHFYPRTDQVSITSSIDSSARITVRWSLGIRRLLTLEPRTGVPYDNLSGLPFQTSSLRLNPAIEYDSTYAVVRDEFGNFIHYSDTLNWQIINTGYASYLNFTGRNPCVIRRLVTSNKSYLLTASIPSGVSLGGMILTSPISDTVPILMSTTVALENKEPKAMPWNFAIEQNVPNPFNPATTICFTLPTYSGSISNTGYGVILDLFDISGHLVKRLADKTLVPGFHSLEWNGRNESGKTVASGIYLYRLIVSNAYGKILFAKNRRMLLTK